MGMGGKLKHVARTRWEGEAARILTHKLSPFHSFLLPSFISLGMSFPCKLCVCLYWQLGNGSEMLFL